MANFDLSQLMGNLGAKEIQKLIHQSIAQMFSDPEVERVCAEEEPGFEDRPDLRPFQYWDSVLLDNRSYSA